MTNSGAERIQRMSDLIQMANQEMKQMFRSNRKIKMSVRNGVILLVDDVELQKGVLECLITATGLQMEVECVPTAEEARLRVEKDSQSIRMIVVDIMLLGSENGLSFAKWLQQQHPNIPFILTTGHEALAEEAERKFPGVDVLVKGRTDVADYADALGINSACEGEEFGQALLPEDR